MWGKFKTLGLSQKVSITAMLLVLMVLPLSLFLAYNQTRLGSRASGSIPNPANNSLPADSPCYGVYKEATCQNCCDPKFCIGAQNVRGCPTMTMGKNQACSGGKICCYRCSTP